MKEYVVIQYNDLLTSVSESFDSMDDAVAYCDIMNRNVNKLSNGKPMWEYVVYEKISSVK